MKCANNECTCVMGEGSASYCCTPCALADEGSYEIAFHSDGCIHRQARRAATKEGLREYLLAQIKAPTPFTDAINQSDEEWPGQDQPWWLDSDRLDSER